MTDLRALITQLCDELDHNHQCLLDDRRLTHPLSDKACAALAETDGPAVSGDREPASVTNQCSGELSPAAQAVLDAFRTSHTEQGCLAAALRAAANQIPYLPENYSSYDVNMQDGREEVREKFLAIAAELEA